MRGEAPKHSFEQAYIYRGYSISIPSFTIMIPQRASFIRPSLNTNSTTIKI